MMMKIRGVEFDFDVYDADQGPAYLEHSGKISALCADMQTNNSNNPLELRSAIVTLVDAVGDMLDEVFGAGSRDKVFGGRHNLNHAIEVFETMNAEVASQKAALDERTNRYSPNRAQRRAAARK